MVAKRKGRSCPLFSDIDLQIFKKLLSEKSVNKTSFECGAYQHVIKRLQHWKRKGLVIFNDSGQSKVTIPNGKKEIIKQQINFFED